MPRPKFLQNKHQQNYNLNTFIKLQTICHRIHQLTVSDSMAFCTFAACGNITDFYFVLNIFIQCTFNHVRPQFPPNSARSTVAPSSSFGYFF